MAKGLIGLASLSLAGAFLPAPRLPAGRALPPLGLRRARSFAAEAPCARQRADLGQNRQPVGVVMMQASAADDFQDWEAGGTDYGDSLSVMTLTCVASSRQEASFGMDVEVLTELLMENGALSVVVEDADYGTERERPIFDEPDEAQQKEWFRVPSEASGDNFWSNCNVTAYFSKDFDIPRVVDMVTSAMQLPVCPRYSIDEVADRDWVKEVQRGWNPILIDDLMLRFPWHTPASVQAFLKAQGVTGAPAYELVLEGGTAFGTGEHPTTRLCCRWLREQLVGGGGQRSVAGDVRVMDYGAGSGVLGLVALAFGAKEAAGVEIDVDSIYAAQANAVANAQPDFRCYLPAESASAGTAADVDMAQKIRNPTGTSACGDAVPLPEDMKDYDMIVANILAGPLVRLAPEIARLCRPAGLLALSGILENQAEMILQAYAPFFDDLAVAANDRGWILVTGTRKGERFEEAARASAAAAISAYSSMQDAGENGGGEGGGVGDRGTCWDVPGDTPGGADHCADTTGGEAKKLIATVAANGLPDLMVEALNITLHHVARWDAVWVVGERDGDVKGERVLRSRTFEASETSSVDVAHGFVAQRHIQSMVKRAGSFLIVVYSFWFLGFTFLRLAILRMALAVYRKAAALFYRK